VTTAKRDDDLAKFYADFSDVELLLLNDDIPSVCEIARRLAESRAEVERLDRVVQARIRMDSWEGDNEAAQMLEDYAMERRSGEEYAIAEAEYEAALAALDTQKEARNDRATANEQRR
jgi:hypothetical protein